jgi:hypothetical protein
MYAVCRGFISNIYKITYDNEMIPCLCSEKEEAVLN